MMTGVRLFVTACLLVAASVPTNAQLDFLNQIGGYLPPVNEPAVTCDAVVRTTTVQRFETTRVVQPITVTTTQTRRAQAVATATMGVTTTMQQVMQQQIQVPITRTYEVTMTSIRTQVQSVPFQPPAVTSVFTSTDVRVQTSVNQQFVTRTQTQERPVLITQTQFNTQFQTSFVQQTVQQTSQVQGQNVERTSTQIQQQFQTQRIPQPARTSVVQTQVVMTSQAVNFVTPRPVVRTQNVQRTSVRTQRQQVFSTQQTVATREVIRTQPVVVTRTETQFSTSIQVMRQIVYRTRYIDRVVTSTQVIPQVVTSTSVINSVNTQYATSTFFNTVVQTQTVQGLNDVREQIITSYRDEVQTVNNFAQANPVTITQTVTRPCQQQQQVVQQTQSGYNYNPPSTSFNLRAG